MNLVGRNRIIVVSGIDSGIGKTTVTGLLARWFSENGSSTITMKMVQTGGSGLSADIIEHRRLSGISLLEEDAMGITCPYIFPLDGDPRLVSRLDGRYVNPEVISDSALTLAETYQTVIIEGVGGLFVPLNDEITVIDLITEMNWPTILVTGPRPGAVNHTLGALEALEHRSIPLQGIVYNLQTGTGTDPRIIGDSRALFSECLGRKGRRGRICDIPMVDCTESYCVDFSPLFT